MWALAEVAGIPAEHFRGSLTGETTAAMTIHDMKLWGHEYRLIERTDDDLGRLLTEEGWLRFTVVRDPAPRLWSAWQSKVLAREPQMLRTFAEADWFPRQPQSPIEIVEHYRRFVAALGEAITDDPLPSLDPMIFNSHWAPQTALLGETGLATLQVTRLADMTETLGMLMKHLADLGFHEPTVPMLNRSILPFSRLSTGHRRPIPFASCTEPTSKHSGSKRRTITNPTASVSGSPACSTFSSHFGRSSRETSEIEILATENTKVTYRVNRAEVVSKTRGKLFVVAPLPSTPLSRPTARCEIDSTPHLPPSGPHRISCDKRTRHCDCPRQSRLRSKRRRRRLPPCRRGRKADR